MKPVVMKEPCRYCGLDVDTPCDVPPVALCETWLHEHMDRTMSQRYIGGGTRMLVARLQDDPEAMRRIHGRSPGRAR
jgi:hypothetical protein